MRESVARRVVFGLLRQIRAGRLTVVEHGTRHEFGAGAPSAIVDVRSAALWPHLLRGGRGLAEAYAQGLWASPDVTAVLRVAARNVSLAAMTRVYASPLARPSSTAMPGDARKATSGTPCSSARSMSRRMRMAPRAPMWPRLTRGSVA